MSENDSCHVPRQMSVCVCEGGGVRVSTLSRTARPHIYTYTQVAYARQGGEGGVIDCVASPAALSHV